MISGFRFFCPSCESPDFVLAVHAPTMRLEPSGPDLVCAACGKRRYCVETEDAGQRVIRWLTMIVGVPVALAILTTPWIVLPGMIVVGVGLSAFNRFRLYRSVPKFRESVRAQIASESARGPDG